MEYNVIYFNCNAKTFEPYNVMPYFVNCYKEEKKKPKTSEELKQFVQAKSIHMYWARCQYECLIAQWPFGSYRIKEDLKKFFASDFDIEKIEDNVKFYNIIMQDMYKIDIHEQIMMNIDIITDILAEEFIK